MRILIALFFVTAATLGVRAEEKPIDPIDFFVDAKTLGGKNVEVGDCLFVAANEYAVFCRSQTGASVDIRIDMKTLDVESQRRSLHDCYQNGANTDCVGFVAGQVVVSDDGEIRLQNSTIRWTK